MIIEAKFLELDNKKICEKVAVCTPFHLQSSMPNDACFIYVLNGTNEVVAPNNKVTAKTNEALLLKCGNYINNIFDSQQKNQFEAIVIHFYPDILKKIYDGGLPDFIGKNKIHKEHKQAIKKIIPDQLLNAYINSMMFYFDNPQLVNDELLALKIKELILLLVQTKNAPEIKYIFDSMFSPEEYHFKETINSNLFENLSLEEIAHLTNRSLSTFKRDFKKWYGETPAKYIRHKRLEKAYQLLSSSERSITSIALDCGYNNIAHFSKSFFEKYHIQPSSLKMTQTEK